MIATLAELLPPAEIVEAAERVRVWMEANGYRNWQLGGVCDRRLAVGMTKERSLAILNGAVTEDGQIQSGKSGADYCHIWRQAARSNTPSEGKDDTVSMDGDFTADQLEAIAFVLRNPNAFRE